MESSEDCQDYRNRMKKFPCAFNLDSVETVRILKLRTMQHNLVSELAINDGSEDECVVKNNLLTWILYRLDQTEEAVQLSNEIITQTNSKNVASLGNHVFILWQTGDKPEATRWLEHLEKMTCEGDFGKRLTEAKAEQAYYYSRLGGPYNLRRAISLFSEAVVQIPGNYLWKFGLGLVYRRATHANIYCSTSERLEVEQYKRKAAEYLFEVADNAESRLKALAYAQLVNLRQMHPRKLSAEYGALFRYLSVQQLCEKALKVNEDIPTVLKHCGKALRAISVDWSITLLEKSVRINPNSVAYHYLAKSYTRKAKLLAKRNRSDQSAERTRALRHSFVQSAEVRGAYSELCGQTAEVGGAGEQMYDHTAEQRGAYGQMNYQTGHVRGYGQMYGQNKHARWEHGQMYGQNEHARWEHGQMYGQNEHASWEHGQMYDQNEHTRWKHGYMYGQTAPVRMAYGNRRSGHRFLAGNWVSRSLSYDSPEMRLHSTSAPVHSINRRGQSICRNIRQSCRYQQENTHQRGRAPSNRPSSSGVSWSPQQEIGIYVRSNKSDTPLNKDEEFVKKACHCFQKAIEIAKENSPAILDLGILLKDTGQIREALTQFNKVTNSHFASKNHRATLISAFEQAGLCYLQLSETDGCDTNCEEMGKKKLTQAIRLAADLTLIMPELKDCAQDLWAAFRTLKVEAFRETPSQNQRKNIIKLLELARDYDEIIEVVRNVRTHSEDDLDDQEFVMIALKSYIKKGQHEDALAFQTLIAVRPAVRDSTWWNNNPMHDLRGKVLLHTILGRLKKDNENPTILFQQLFELSFGTCVGLCALEEDEQTSPAGDFVGDVLFVFDGDQNCAEDPSPAVKSGRCLKKVATCLFGLEAEENLKGSGKHVGDTAKLQLEEMRKYQCVIIVLGNDTREPKFDAIIHSVPYIKDPDTPTNQRIMVIDAGLRDGQVPLCLRPYQCFKVEDIGGLGDVEQCHNDGDEDDQPSFPDILTSVFHGDVDAVLKLFCFMTGQQWPCTFED